MTRVTWYVSRARAMNAQELLHRTRELVRRRKYKRFPPGVALPEEGRRSIFAATIQQWSGAPHLGAFWCRCAGQLEDERIEIFGLLWPYRAGEPNWHQDPATGYVWPADYCFDIDHRRRSLGEADIKHVWEVNRLLYLLPTAACAWLDDDHDKAALCVRHVESWLEANPPYRGVAWGSGIECAMRVIALVALDEMLEEFSTQEFQSAVRTSVGVHVDWIRRFPSKYSSANNHRLAELTGELVGAARFPGMVSRTRFATALAELEREAQAQFFVDGVSGEQATGYAGFALEWLALARAAASTAGQPFGSETEGRMQAAIGALGLFTDSNGNTVPIGDADESRLLTSLVPTVDYLTALNSLVSGQWSLPERPPGLRTLIEGGYSVVRDSVPSEEALWVLDHGPLGYGRLAAHAHADTLAVWLHYRGAPLFVDAGTYLYHGAGSWRDTLRSTSLHNTLTVGQRDSSTASGAFNWSTHRASGRLIEAGTDGENWFVEAEHDGYRNPFGVLHRRRLEALSPLHYRLTDRLVGGASLPCRFSLLLAPDVDQIEQTQGWALFREGEPLAVISTPSGWALKSWRASEAGLGWHSPTFGSLVPTWQLTLDGLLGPGDELWVDITLVPTPHTRGS